MIVRRSTAGALETVRSLWNVYLAGESAHSCEWTFVRGYRARDIVSVTEIAYVICTAVRCRDEELLLGELMRLHVL